MKKELVFPLYFSSIVMIGIPPYLAATWFSSDRVSTVTSIAVFGNQVGIALGFFIPTLLVPDVDDFHLIGIRLRILYYSVAFICVSCFFVMIIGKSKWSLQISNDLIMLIYNSVFRPAPPTPPSRAQEKALQNNEQHYGRTLKRLLTNKWFILLLLSYGNL